MARPRRFDFQTGPAKVRVYFNPCAVKMECSSQTPGVFMDKVKYVWAFPDKAETSNSTTRK